MTQLCVYFQVLHYRVRILQTKSDIPSPSTRRVAAIRDAKEAFLGSTSPAPIAIIDEPSSMTSSIVVAEVDVTGSSSSFEHVDDHHEKVSHKSVDITAAKKELNPFDKEFPIAVTTELRSPALLSRFNSIPKPPRHSLERAITAADVAAMQPLLTSAEDASPHVDDGPVPSPPTTPMPKDEKAVAFAKTIMN